jgi:cyclophilin family peptidyl-prolyl cis-trans isomerase
MTALSCSKQNKTFTAETGNTPKKVDFFPRIPFFSGKCCCFFLLTIAFFASCAHGAGNAGTAHFLLLHPENATWEQTAPDVSRVRFETTKGKFTIEVVRDWSPKGADRFYNLVRLGFFDDVRFTRVVPNWIAQFGISGDPAVNAVWRETPIPDDPPFKQTNARGTVAFAFKDPNTRTTQVFISLTDNKRLDAQGFTPFGRAVEGMDIVDKLNSEYGEKSGGGIRAGKQGPLEQGGNAYIDHEYPRLDYILHATIVKR